jgi:outer membrane protein
VRFSLVASPLLLATVMVAPLAAQTNTAPERITLSIGDVLRMADSASEAVGIARAGIRAAGGRLLQARSGWLPQLSGAATYTRTLESQFEALQGDSGGNGNAEPAPVNCTRFRPNPTLSAAARLDSLERGLDCTANGSGEIDFSKLPFGQANQWSFGLDLQQTIFDPTLSARIRQASAGEAAARATLATARSGAVLEVAQAYYDALLAARLSEIADNTLAQAERTQRDVELAYRVGNAAEFDLLRATVARDNQRPQVIQRRTQHTLARLKLLQLLDLPVDAMLELTTPLGDTTAIPLPAFAGRVAANSDGAISSRAVVRAAGAAADAAEAQAAAGRGQRLPTVRFSSAYSKLTFPDEVFGWKNFLTDWNVAVRVSVPLFTGGRIRGQVQEAEAAAEQARLQLRQVRESALRENVEVEDQLDAALATFEASRATTAQAARAYEIAEIRTREGISTLTDLADVRLQLEQAEANRAQAARDLQVARLRALLLRDLPLGAGRPGSSGGL